MDENSSQFAARCEALRVRGEDQFELVIGCAYAAFPVIGPVGQSLNSLLLRASLLPAVFK